jgi:PII-like signaling protein
LIIDFSIKNKISSATVWTGVDGFGKRRRSTVTLEGITVNMPTVVEVIDEKSKLEPLLPELRMIVDDNGMVTVHEVDII